MWRKSVMWSKIVYTLWPFIPFYTVFLQFTHFVWKIIRDKKLWPWRKNYKYEVCIFLLLTFFFFLFFEMQCICKPADTQETCSCRCALFSSPALFNLALLVIWVKFPCFDIWSKCCYAHFPPLFSFVPSYFRGQLSILWKAQEVWSSWCNPSFSALAFSLLSPVI